MCALVYPVSPHAYKILITEWTKSNVNKQFLVHTFEEKSAPRRAEKAVTKCVTSNSL